MTHRSQPPHLHKVCSGNRHRGTSIGLPIGLHPKSNHGSSSRAEPPSNKKHNKVLIESKKRKNQRRRISPNDIDQTMRLCMTVGTPETLLENISYTKNFSNMKKRYLCADVYPIVETRLARSQDKRYKNRRDLADELSMNLKRVLKQDVNGRAKTAEIGLFVRITVVSDGQSWRLSSFRRTVGRAKLAMSYSLYSRITGEIYLSKQMGETTEYIGKSHSKGGIPEVYNMAQDMLFTMGREVKFVCCSRLNNWFVHAESLVS